jgi:hypothetical protein
VFGRGAVGFHFDPLDEALAGVPVVVADVDGGVCLGGNDVTGRVAGVDGGDRGDRGLEPVAAVVERRRGEPVEQADERGQGLRAGAG